MTGEEGEEAGVRLRGMRLETTVHGIKMQSTTETLKKKKKKARRVSTQAVVLKAQRTENGLKQ